MSREQTGAFKLGKNDIQEIKCTTITVCVCVRACVRACVCALVRGH